MDVIKIDFKGTICENVQLLDWLMNRVMGRALAKRTINITMTKKFAEISDRPDDSKIKEDIDPPNQFTRKVKLVTEWGRRIRKFTHETAYGC
jgi:hypothetical protein